MDSFHHFHMEHERFHVTYVRLPEILPRYFFLAILLLGNQSQSQMFGFDILKKNGYQVSLMCLLRLDILLPSKFGVSNNPKQSDHVF